MSPASIRTNTAIKSTIQSLMLECTQCRYLAYIRYIIIAVSGEETCVDLFNWVAFDFVQIKNSEH